MFCAIVTNSSTYCYEETMKLKRRQLFYHSKQISLWSYDQLLSVDAQILQIVGFFKYRVPSMEMNISCCRREAWQVLWLKMLLFTV